MSDGAIDLSAYSDRLDTALADGFPMVLATSLDGQPDLAFKGSLLVWDGDHLAYWERSRMETLAALRENPRVAVLYRRPGQPPLRFYGEVRMVEDEQLRDQIWSRVNEIERRQDPDRRGLAVLIRVDRVRQGRTVVQQR